MKALKDFLNAIILVIGGIAFIAALGPIGFFIVLLLIKHKKTTAAC
ncbi:MAG: hypothetical protein NTW44_08060 [Nitrospirae bacterium]|nr:hypothetical protein [Nitrospirota bacterium]